MEEVLQESKKLPTMKEFNDFLLTIKNEEWYDYSGRLRNSMIAKRSFLVLCQTVLIAFLFREAI